MFGDSVFAERPFAALEDIYLYVDASSSVVADFEYVIYVGTRWFATSPTDTPPNRPFRGTLLEPLNFRRSILGSTMGVYSTGDGRLVIDNADAYYDNLIQLYGVDGRDITIKVGRTTDAYVDRPIIFKGTAADWNVNEQTVSFALRDFSYKLNVPAQPNLYGGTGGSDGGSDLAKKRKPRAFGYVRNITPAFVVPSLLIYQVHDGAVNDVSAVYDRGTALTRGSDYATYALLAAATISAGQYGTSLAEGFFKLGSQPAGTVTADVQGDGGDSNFRYTTGDIVRQLISSTTSLVDPTDLNTTSFTNLNTTQPAAVGYYLGPDATETVADVIANLMGGIGGWGGFRRDGTFEVKIFTAPSGNAEATYTRLDIIDLVREPLPDGTIPPWRQRVPYQRAWTVQTDLAGSVSASHKAFVADPFRLAEASNTTIKIDHPFARDPEPVQAYFDAQADAETEATRLLNLYKTVRALYRMKLPRRALTLDLGDPIQVTYPRWDLSTGRLMRVVEINENLSPPSPGTIDYVEVVAYG